MKFLLDTCAILWAVSAPEKLSEKARTLMTERTSQIFVSPMSCMEIACLVDRRRITLDRHWRIWFRNHIEKNGWSVVEVDLSIAEEAYSLPGDFHRDPVDRVLVATARLLQAPILTADRLITDYPHVRSEW